MRRILAALAVASLAVVACGKDAPPKAFPGSALDKARELTRREAELGLPHRSVKGAVFVYGTVGDGFCAEKDPEKRKDLGLLPGMTRQQQEQAIQQANLVVEVYCPWLSRFPAQQPSRETESTQTRGAAPARNTERASDSDDYASLFPVYLDEVINTIPFHGRLRPPDAHGIEWLAG